MPEYSPKYWISPHGRPLPQPGAHTLIMGIVNVTPDSFSDGGHFLAADAALAQVERMITAGVDVVDIGGESTRPGAAPVSAQEEARRVIPVITAIRREFTQLPLSIDTYKAEIARAGVQAGADIINDIWGARYGLDPQQQAAWNKAVSQDASTTDLTVSPMAATAAELGAPLILMHNRPLPQYRDFWPEVCLDLQVSLQMSLQAGLQKHQLWLDPGFGFGKTPPHNLEVLKRLSKVVQLGYPVLLGTSRKSTIGIVLDKSVQERELGSAVTHAWGIAQGCAMIRVHDVAWARETALMADAIRAGHQFDLQPTAK
ncbi:MAG: dihydropteroate synthase [Verrucomicrobiota bacterium]